MSWRDNLLPAAFDGIPFLYKDVSTRIGRRTEVHEFPLRDDPFVEDLGRSARRWTVRGFLIGENYASTLADLRAAFERGGEHTFSHPYHGIYTVKMEGPATITETDDEGRMARFDVTLVESGFAFELVAVDTPHKVKVLADDALDVLSKKTKFSLLKAIGAVLKSIANGIETANSAIRNVNGKIGGALSLVDNITSAINDFRSELTTLLNQPQVLMNKLTALVASVIRLVKDFFPTVPPPGVRVEIPDTTGITLDALEELFSFEIEESVIQVPTPQQAIEQEAQAAVEFAVKGAALAAAADVLADEELDSAAQAVAIQDNLVDKFDQVLGEDVDPEVYETFAALKAATIEHFTSQALQLPAVAEYVTPGQVSALVLAYELHGDALMDDDIIKRNRIRHPAFIPGGMSLEILANVG